MHLDFYTSTVGALWEHYGSRSRLSSQRVGVLRTTLNKYTDL